MAIAVSTSPKRNHRGFTLIEVMLVIVIMSIFASLVVISISGIDQRRLMQQREQLVNDLNVMRLESSDQARVFALMTIPATATEQSGYLFAEYQPPAQNNAGAMQNGTAILEKKPLWKPVEAFKERHFSDNAYLQVRSMDNSHQANGQVAGLLDQQAPDLIWFGNGEVKPARLQLIYNNQPVGEPVYVNATGRVSNTEQPQ